MIVQQQRRREKNIPSKSTSTFASEKLISLSISFYALVHSIHSKPKLIVRTVRERENNQQQQKIQMNDNDNFMNSIFDDIFIVRDKVEILRHN